MIYNRNPSGEHNLWWGTDFAAIIFWGVQISQNMDLGVHTLGVEILCDRSEMSVR